MLRFIIRRQYKHSGIVRGSTDSYETVDIDVPELEHILVSAQPGAEYDIRELVGVECIAKVAPQAKKDEVKWRDVMTQLVAHIEMNTCTHDDTYRGGGIWEICRDCGEMWADDRGGKPKFVWPNYVKRAREMLAETGEIDE